MCELQSASLLEGLVGRVQKLNRRSLDRFSAKIYYFMALCYEVQGKLKDLRPYAKLQLTYLNLSGNS